MPRSPRRQLVLGQLVINAIYGQGGQLIGFAKITRDITHRRKNEEYLRRLALTDGLTGLSNRHAFLYELAKIVHSQPAALLLLDLDGFKEINDTLGIGPATPCSRRSAFRLKETAAGASGIARIGGDEFAIVFARYDRSDLGRHAAPHRSSMRFAARSSAMKRFASRGQRRNRDCAERR